MNREKLHGFIKQFFGQGNFLVVSVPMIRLMDNEPEGALFLSQLVYWSDKSQLRDGWFYKSYADWEKEIFLSEYKIKKFSKFLSEKGVLETQVKKIYGAPTLHYRVNLQQLMDWLIESHNLEKPDLEPPILAAEPPAPKPESEWDKQKEAIWDAIPGPPAPLKATQEGKKINQWAAQYKVLTKAPDWAKTVSYHVNVQTGFEPTTQAKQWLSECQQLWSAAKQNEQNLIAGLQAGEKARQERGLTMSGPRSYINFCRNQVALQNRSGQGQSGEKDVLGQTVRHTRQGRTIVEIE